jgi:hypothetical protein
MGCASCRPRSPQGPYYISGQLVRQDITEGKQGFPLNIAITVVDYTNGCNTPMAGLPVEIWHCDAWGYYSAYTSTSPGGTVPAYDNVGDPNMNLRGVQVTDDNGLVTFTSIVPGWYSPRVTHIHVKVHQGGDIGSSDTGGPGGGGGPGGPGGPPPTGTPGPPPTTPQQPACSAATDRRRWPEPRRAVSTLR